MNEIEKLEQAICRVHEIKGNLRTHVDFDLATELMGAVEEMANASIAHLHYKREIEPFVSNLLSEICGVDIDKSYQSERDIIYSIQTMAACIAAKLKERV